MAKQTKKEAKEEILIPTNTDELTLLLEHYKQGSDDMDRRRLGNGNNPGWNKILDAYHNKLPKDWPYLSKVTDPVIRTTILEKTARLFNGKLKGKVTPREGGDNIGARIHNAILDFQWDEADRGGTMLEKWAYMDMQTRLYGASFGLTYWDAEKRTNEFKVLDPRDILIDPSATHIRNANWVQVREWKLLEDLIEENENAIEAGGDPLYPNLQRLIDNVKENKGGDSRESVYESHIKNLRGLEDKTGQDQQFPIVEFVTEYRKDKWIYFAPQHSLYLGEIEEPRKDKKIPITQLRYYPTPDDIYGEIEVLPVMSLASGINAILCGAVDEANITMSPPIKVANSDGSVRVDTIVYGPNAIWQTGTSINNVGEHQTQGVFVNNFQTMYTALKSAFNVAMGDTSMGVSNLDPTSQDKTATEVKALERQKISRDQYNQLYLEVALKDQIMLWLSNNKQFLFADGKNTPYILRIVGRDMLKDLKQMELDSMTEDPEALKMVTDLVREKEGEISDAELQQLYELTRVPMYPVITGDKPDIKPKLDVEEDDSMGVLTILPEDLDGEYDYVPDVQSMALGADAEQRQGRQSALEVLKDGTITGLLNQQGYTLQAKDIVVSVLRDKGYKDAEKFIVSNEQQPNTARNTTNGTGQNIMGIDPTQGMANSINPNGGDSQQQVPQPQGQGVQVQPF